MSSLRCPVVVVRVRLAVALANFVPYCCLFSRLSPSSTGHCHPGLCSCRKLPGAQVQCGEKERENEVTNALLYQAIKQLGFMTLLLRHFMSLQASAQVAGLLFSFVVSFIALLFFLRATADSQHTPQPQGAVSLACHGAGQRLHQSSPVHPSFAAPPASAFSSAPPDLLGLDSIP